MHHFLCVCVDWTKNHWIIIHWIEIHIWKGIMARDMKLHHNIEPLWRVLKKYKLHTRKILPVSMEFFVKVSIMQNLWLLRSNHVPRWFAQVMLL